MLCCTKGQEGAKLGAWRHLQVEGTLHTAPGEGMAGARSLASALVRQ